MYLAPLPKPHLAYTTPTHEPPTPYASYCRSPTFLPPFPPSNHPPHFKIQIPKASAFNKIRLTLVALLAIPSAAEYYDFIANPLALRLGPNAWCMLAVMQVSA